MKIIDKILGTLHLNFLNRKNSPSVTVQKSSVGGDVVAGDKTIIKQVKGKVQDDLKRLEYLLENSSWHKEIIDHKDVWICNEDNMCQIEIGEKERDFTEKWTQVYPDKYGSEAHSVYLKIKGVVIRQLLFVSCDGGRIFVPVPKRKTVNGKSLFYFDSNSLEYKLAKIIGDFYIYETIEGVAKISQIEII